MEGLGLPQQAQRYNMISIEEKQKFIKIRIKGYKDEIYRLSEVTALLNPGDPEIDIKTSEYGDLVKSIKSLENELSLLTNNDQ